MERAGPFASAPPVSTDCATDGAVAGDAAIEAAAVFEAPTRLAAALASRRETEAASASNERQRRADCSLDEDNMDAEPAKSDLPAPRGDDDDDEEEEEEKEELEFACIEAEPDIDENLLPASEEDFECLGFSS
jgi:hypothetical protein